MFSIVHWLSPAVKIRTCLIVEIKQNRGLNIIFFYEYTIYKKENVLVNNTSKMKAR